VTRRQRLAGTYCLQLQDRGEGGDRLFLRNAFTHKATWCQNPEATFAAVNTLKISFVTPSLSHYICFFLRLVLIKVDEVSVEHHILDLFFSVYVQYGDANE
jgi:hypothetical protein